MKLGSRRAGFLLLLSAVPAQSSAHAGVLVTLASTVVPPPAPLPDWAKVVRQVPRKALIIGVDGYDHATQLATPVHDVDLMTSTLKTLDFSVAPQFVLKGRLERTPLLNAIKAFASTLDEGDVAFVYFSGHGVDRDGFNYLVPSDAIANADNPATAYVPLTYLLEQLDKAHPAAAVILLDACRVDPFTGTSPESRDLLDMAAPAPAQPAPAAPVPVPRRNSVASPSTTAAVLQGGLARVDSGPPAVLLEYASQPDHPAYSLFRGDPPSLGSIFTRKLVYRLQQMKDQPIKEILSVTETDVFTVTRSQQRPYENPFGLSYLLLSRNQYLAEMEEDMWARTAATQSPAQAVQALQYFLRLFPNSDHSYAARQRLAELTSAEPRTEVAATSAYALPLQVFGALQTVGQQADGTATAVANSDVALRGNWSKRFTENRLTTIKMGQLVTVLGAQPGSSAVKVMTNEGTVGYVGHVAVVANDVVAARATLSFQSSDPFADALDWQPLANLNQALSSDYAAVTIRTALDSDTDAPDQTAQLRALRLRDALIARGVPQEKVTIEPADPHLSSHTAEIAVAKAVSP